MRRLIIEIILHLLHQGAIAKWLRRQIRNLFSFGGAGSNPAGVELQKVFAQSANSWSLGRSCCRRVTGNVLDMAVAYHPLLLHRLRGRTN